MRNDPSNTSTSTANISIASLQQFMLKCAPYARSIQAGFESAVPYGNEAYKQ